MSPVLDDLLIAIALAASVGYALFSLGPVSLRRRMRAALADLAARAPARMHLGGIERRLRDDGAGGCGGCGSCSTQPTDTPARPTEIRVPAGKIGRRRDG